MHVLDPNPAQIHIIDIAHGLSSMPRYSGQIDPRFTVGEHSLYVANLILYEKHSKQLALAGLLHDASEAFLSDIPRPAKNFCNNYLQIEKRFMQAIFKRFDLDLALLEKVAKYDIMAYKAELRDVTDREVHVDDHPDIPAGLLPVIRYDNSREIRYEFYEKYLELSQ